MGNKNYQKLHQFVTLLTFCDCIPIWQESCRVSSNCTVVLWADACDNQQNNVKYFNKTDVSYSKKPSLDMYVRTSQSRL
jgi:hypothetical protein